LRSPSIPSSPPYQAHTIHTLQQCRIDPSDHRLVIPVVRQSSSHASPTRQKKTTPAPASTQVPLT
jgi:hypothetical protein